MIQAIAPVLIFPRLTNSQFESGMRKAAIDLLAHPYFSGLHDESDEPVSESETTFHLDREMVQVSTALKGLGKRTESMSLKELRDAIAEMSLESMTWKKQG
eukprot:766544-Hanusia_phi.AAC.11